MYDELVKRLREADVKSMCGECGLNLHTGATKKGVLFAEAADAIERLSRECKVLYAMLGTHPDPRGELGDPGVLREPPKEEA